MHWATANGGALHRDLQARPRRWSRSTSDRRPSRPSTRTASGGGTSCCTDACSRIRPGSCRCFAPERDAVESGVVRPSTRAGDRVRRSRPALGALDRHRRRRGDRARHAARSGRGATGRSATGGPASRSGRTWRGTGHRETRSAVPDAGPPRPSRVRRAREPRQGRRVRGARAGPRDGRARRRALPRRVRRTAGSTTATATAACSTSGTATPAVVAAVRAALDDLDIGNHHLVSGWRAALAERLAATHGRAPAGRRVRRRRRARPTTSRSSSPGPTPGAGGVVSAIGGYHGHTGLSLAAGDPEYRDPFGPNLPGFTQVPFDDLAALDRGRRRHDRGGRSSSRSRRRSECRSLRRATWPASSGSAGPRRVPRARRGADRPRPHRHHVVLPAGRPPSRSGHHRQGSERRRSIPITATLMTAEIHAFFDEHPVRAHLDVRRRRARLRRGARRARRDRGAGLPRTGRGGRRALRVDEFADLPFELRRRGLFMGLKFAGRGRRDAGRTGR